MIAWRFGFEPLGARASSINMAHALDFASPPNLSAPAFDVPAGPFGVLCVPLTGILDLAGIPLPVPVPLPAGTPLPILFSFPPVPGLDVPLPTADSTTAPSTADSTRTQENDAARRRVDHESELENIRALGRRHGFGVRRELA
jgi:phospholipase C